MAIFDWIDEEEYEFWQKQRKADRKAQDAEASRRYAQPGPFDDGFQQAQRMEPLRTLQPAPIPEPEPPQPMQSPEWSQVQQPYEQPGPFDVGAMPQGRVRRTDEPLPERPSAMQPAGDILGNAWQAARAQKKDLLSEIGDIARELGHDDDGARAAQAIARTEGALEGQIGDTNLPGGGSMGPFQFYKKYGMLPAYAKSLGMTEDQAGEYARANPQHAARWALQGYLGQAIKEGQAKGLKGADLATYAQTHGQRSQSPERAGQNYQAMFGGSVSPVMQQGQAQQVPLRTLRRPAEEGRPERDPLKEFGDNLFGGLSPREEQRQPERMRTIGENTAPDVNVPTQPLGGIASALQGAGQLMGNIPEPVADALWQGALGPLGQKPVRDYLGQRVGGVAQGVGEAAQGFQENVGTPFAMSFFTPKKLESGKVIPALAGPSQPTFAKDLLQEGWQGAKEKANERFGEFDPTAQFGLSVLADPLNVAGLDPALLLKPALKGLGAAAKVAAPTVRAAREALPEVGRALKGAGKAYLEAAADTPVGLTVQDVSKAPLATTEPAPTFYSQLERTLADAKQPKWRAGDLRGYLRAAGVKDEELKWTGFDDYLQERASAGQSVTREEALQFVKDNQVEVKEVVKGQPMKAKWEPDPVSTVGALVDPQSGIRIQPMDDGQFKLMRKGQPVSFHATMDEAKAAVENLWDGTLGVNPTKFSQYQTPGGENYRELLLTLPEKPIDDSAFKAYQAELRAKYGSDATIVDKATPAELDRLDQLGDGTRGVQYKSTHFDDTPNVLAHVRFNERVDASGKKVLFVEEVQSDWHQAGRQKGYQLNPRAAQRLQAREEGLRQQTALMPDGPEREALLNEHADIVGQLWNWNKGVPAAPFSKTWPELAMKRVVRWAASNGYDRVAWTRGAQQVGRYEDALRKSVDAIEWRKTDDTVQIVGRKGSSETFNEAIPIQGTTTLNGQQVDLTDLVGKKIATDIRTSGDLQGVVTGNDLTIAGEGMKGFYDQILPEVMNKLGKKFGARVGQGKIPTGKPGSQLNVVTEDGRRWYVEDYVTQERVAGPFNSEVAADSAATSMAVGSEPVHAIDITPSMRQSVVTKGQPLFMAPEATGAVLGGAYGLATDDPNLSDRERLSEFLQKTAGGGLTARILTKGMKGVRPGLNVEDVGKGLDQAFTDWNGGRAYIDNAGNYRVRPEGKKQGSGPIAPWNKEAKAVFKDVSEFHNAAQAAKTAPEVPLTPEQAKAAFQDKWAKAYGDRPDTVPIAKPERPVTPEAPELTMEEARKFAKMTDEELAEYNARQAATPEPLAAKQPWEITKGEWDTAVNPIRQARDAGNWQDVSGIEAAQQQFKDQFGYWPDNLNHRGLVEVALREGKPVPDDVLKDYPDLVKAAPEPELKPPLTEPAPIKETAPTLAQEAATPPIASVDDAVPTLEVGQPASTAPTTASELADAVTTPQVDALDDVAAQGPPRPPEGPLGTLEPPSQPDSWLSTVKPTSAILELAYRPDWPRRLADANPALGRIMQRVGVPLRSIPVQGRVLYESIKADWNSGLVGAVARLRQMGDSKNLFSLDKDGLATLQDGKRAALNDVLEYPDRYSLAPEQRKYAATIHKLYDDSRDLLAAEGIDIKELGFEEGGHYVGRRVLGRVDDQGNIVIGMLPGPGGKRIGGRTPFEKSREFNTQAEALSEGFRYLTPEEALQANLQAAGKKIADKRLADFILENIPYRKGAAPEELKLARDHAKDKLAALGQLQAVINRAARGERIPVPTIRSIGQYWPEQAKGLVTAGVTKTSRPLAPDAATITARTNLNRAKGSLNMLDELRNRAIAAGDEGQATRLQGRMVETQDQINRFERDLTAATQRQAPKLEAREQLDDAARQAIDDVKGSIVAAKAEAQSAYYRAQSALARASEQARRPRYGESGIQTPAFQGKLFDEKDAAAIRKMLDLEPKGKLRSTAEIVAWANSLPRLLLTTLDVGGATIQLQLIAFYKPEVFAKSVGQALRALRSDRGYQQFLATHADTVKKWGAEGAIFTPSEFTEAAAPQGTLSKIPMAGKAMKPFVRSWEALLNAAKVYGLEATEHMAKTPEEIRDLATFWNEMTGVTNRARAGISPTQGAVETALMFAPRYNAAILALITDVSRGGLRGKMARESLAKAVIGGLAGYVGVSYMLGQEPHLDPREGGKFLTIEVAGQRIGMGGAFIAATRTMGQAVLDPGKAHEYAGRFLQSRVSPVVGTVRDLAPHYNRQTGQIEGPQDFMGQTIDTPLKLTKRVFADNLLPIWAQAFTEAAGDWTGASIRAGAEFGGLRTFSTSPAERRDAAIADAAKALGKKPEELDRAEYDRLRRENPEVAKLTAKATEAYAERGSAYHQYKKETNAAREQILGQMAALKADLDKGAISGKEYREEIQLRERDMANVHDNALLYNAGFRAALAEIEKSRGEDAKAKPELDRYLDDYYAITKDLIDSKTERLTDVGELLRRREELKTRYPADVVQRATQYLNRNRDPQYVQALDEYRQYKDIELRVTKMTPEQLRLSGAFLRMKNDIAQTLPPIEEKSEYALMMAAKRDPKGYEQYTKRMYIERMIGKELKMMKQDFWAKHPLLQKFFSDAPAQVPAKAAS